MDGVSLEQAQSTSLSSIDDQVFLRLTEPIAPLVGYRLGHIANDTGLQLSAAKNAASAFIRKLCPGLTAAPGGPLIRVPRCNDDLLPYESVSLPAFNPDQLLTEEWERSALRRDLAEVVWIPLVAPSRATPVQEIILTPPRLWRPSRDDWAAMQTEWEMYRSYLRRGVLPLPPASSTRALHVRPHGRDSDDRYELPGGALMVRSSFWLNREFVQAVLCDL